MEKPLNVGIVGCGVISDFHANAYRGHPGATLLWACDLRPERAARLAGAFEIPNQTTDVLEALEDPRLDAISICTDHGSHAAIAAAALERGKHVLCEKSLAESEESLDQMRAAHQRRPELVFSGVFQHRFDPVYQALREKVRDGVLGTMLTMDLRMLCLRTHEYYRADAWRGTWAQEGGSVLINQAIHFIDLLQWIGGDVEAVAGAYANRSHQGVIETEDTATASLRFRNGSLGSLTATASSPVSFEPTLTLSGTEGMIEVRDGKHIRVVWRDAEAGRRLEEELNAGIGSLAEEQAKAYYGMGHPAQIADFIDSIQEGRSPLVTALSAARTTELVLAIYRSHQQGAWIRLTEPGPETAAGG